MLYPTQDRRVCQINAAFGHHSDQITIAELVAELPANVQDHDLLAEVATFEQLFDRYELRHFSIIAKPICVCTRAIARMVPVYLSYAISAYRSKQ
jgi:hypothetical protein